ncbi:hypothetical protein [Acetobacter senegalensis]|uniref:hypothetical protein n=2 Tax=Acetobacter senegalensis TaxID=446692 RepID=UPI001ED9E4B7|nr:hypothetical protein [Acetobacter senegalensis]
MVSFSRMKQRMLESLAQGAEITKIPVPLLCSILLLALCYFASYSVLPFSNGDIAYYVIIGRGILRDHLLPYSYAFDHKPLAVYLVYAVWDQIIPLSYGKFELLACLLMGAFVWFCRAFGPFNKGLAWLILTVGGSVFGILDANTETVLVAGEALFLRLLYQGNTQGKLLQFFGAGLVFAGIVNVNYLSAVCLFLPSLFLFLASGWFRIRHILLAALGLVTGLALLFAPYFVVGHGALQAYFSMQSAFLHHYGASLKARMRSVLRCAIYTVLLFPVLQGWIRVFPLALKGEDRKTLVLLLWFLSSLPAVILSGHPFEHYFILCFAPAAIMAAILFEKKYVFPTYCFVPFTFFFVGGMIQDTRKNIDERLYYSRVDYAFLSKEIGTQKVLNIRGSHETFYLADLRPFDVYLFPTHIDILFGKENAWKRYMQDLLRRPAYVITPYAGCARNLVEPVVCQWLATHYTRIYSLNTRHARPEKDQRFSLDLYKLTLPEQHDDLANQTHSLQ